MSEEVKVEQKWLQTKGTKITSELKVDKIMSDLFDISATVQKVAETIQDIERLPESCEITHKTQSENLETILDLIQINTSVASKSFKMLTRFKNTGAT